MELTPEQVNDFIAKAVLESQIGTAVMESVKRVMEDLKKTYNNPFDEVVKRAVYTLIENEVKTTFKPQLEEGIKSAMAIWATDEIISKIIDAGLERLRNRY